MRTKLVGLTLAIALTVSCGTVAKTADNALEGLKGTYVAAETARRSYCRPKVPKPQVCVDSYKPMLAAYTVLSEGNELLAQFLETKDKTLEARLVSLTAAIPHVVATVFDAVALLKPAPAPVVSTAPPEK
jgi:hypothetical protein